ncbi:unnamed protein product, partial [Staurois parvus]
MWGDQRVNCVLCAVSHYVLCVCITVSTLHCMVLLCRAVQSSVQELKGENCVVYTQVSP